MRRSNNKLAFRYFGPYSISKCINPVAYEVELPQDSKIHPVFHVSLLRKVLKQGMPSSPTLPVSTDDITLVHVKILDHRWHHTPTGRREQVQVQWPAGGDKDVTWEDKLQLHQQFPDSMAWGQAMPQGGGDVNVSTGKGDATTDVGLKSKSTRPKRIVQPNRRHVWPEWTQ